LQSTADAVSVITGSNEFELRLVVIWRLHKDHLGLPQVRRKHQKKREALH
jgi:hypothetical protein